MKQKWICPGEPISRGPVARLASIDKLMKHLPTKTDTEFALKTAKKLWLGLKLGK